MTMNILDFLLAYFATNLLEFIPLQLLVKKPFKEKIFALVLINSATLPAFWIILPIFYSNYFAAFLVGETVIIIAEAVLLKAILKLDNWQAVKASLLMNLFSAAIGFVLL